MNQNLPSEMAKTKYQESAMEYAKEYLIEILNFEIVKERYIEEKIEKMVEEKVQKIMAEKEKLSKEKNLPINDSKEDER